MFRGVTLEVSLKPFKGTDDEYIQNVCRGIFKQWRPLLKDREEISVMLWVGDGSEILDYDGDLDKPLEWAYFLGTANLPMLSETEDPMESLHVKTRRYMENPPVMTYRILQKIVSRLKEEGAKLYPNAKICVGETFDIGPEFAISDFKYNRHLEITGGSKINGRFGFIDSTAALNADSRKYAAYPNGIPQGTPFAAFLGAQTKAFFADMGFDYLWLSNGLGFSANPWDMTGKIYDGEKFHPEKLQETAKNVFGFWQAFRNACPDIPVKTRGTNNSVGIDYATDGVALYDIYNADFHFLPPPNSPWAALNGDYGLELMGHMSRICHLPEDDFLFRFYLHDPWWMNSPWKDRYEGYPTDVYLPMSILRIDENGKAQSASQFHILSIDNSLGGMPDDCANESIPHILRAEKDGADGRSFLVWVYPVKEYTSATGEGWLSEMFFADKFIASGINHGFPLNCVVSTDNFLRLTSETFAGRILVVPFLDNPSVQKKLQDFVDGGGKAVVYGSKSLWEKYALPGENVVFADIHGEPTALVNALQKFGYDIRFKRKNANAKLPVWNVTRSKNGNFFSVYNPDTTTDTLLKFPLGAPILLGGETEIQGGCAVYRFGRCEHRECRVFVRQESGVISAMERAPVSGKFRRRFRIQGLQDATVYYFPESDCCGEIAVETEEAEWRAPEMDGGWTPYYDEVYGTGFKAEHKTGRLCFMMPFPQYVRGTK